jgi:hypothetical protein
VVIIAKGHIAAEGTPEEIRARMTSGSREAELVLRGDEQTAVQALNGCSGIRVLGTPTRIDSDEGGMSVWRVVLSVSEENGGAAPRMEAAVRACVQADVGVRGAELRSKSLETIFHELTIAEGNSLLRKGASS